MPNNKNMSAILIGSMEKFADFVNEGTRKLNSVKYKKTLKIKLKLLKN